MLINELDSDIVSADTQEFVELYDGGAGGTALDGLVVVFYNGAGDSSYTAFDLDGRTTDASGFFLLGNAAVTPTPSIIFPDITLQNGADAVAVYTGNGTDFPNGTAVTTVNLLDAVVYDTDDPDDVGLLALLNPLQPQVNEDAGGAGVTNSIQRAPNGAGGQRNTTSFVAASPTPGAATTVDPSLPNCDDGVDNDLDTTIDGADPDCQTGGTGELSPYCTDGVDNDRNGDTDLADSSCTIDGDGEAPAFLCADAVDNDFDGNTDLADSACLPGQTGEVHGTCTDGADNDDNGFTDFGDFGCASSGSELHARCSDTIDNDGDGNADLDDADCTTAGDEHHPGCGDGQDNDLDELIDDADPDCAPLGPGEFHASCDDGFDNDANGFTDTNDIACADGGPEPNNADLPSTTIDSGPKKRTTKRTARFTFSSAALDLARFECKLDARPFRTCTSPKTYRRLKPRKHTFKVRAIDAGGVADPTPATKRWTIKKKRRR